MMIDQLCADLDGLQNELSATKLQLASKCEAIKILSERLNESKAETEQFKLMAEQLQERYRALKKTLGSDSLYTATPEESQKNIFLKLKVKLHESEMSNRILETEITKLRRRTTELTNDLTMLRKTAGDQNEFVQKEAEVNARLTGAHEREFLVAQLESKSLECDRWRRDLELCQDENNELLSVIQAYKESDHLDVSKQQIEEGQLTLLRENESLSRQVSYLESEKRLLSQTLAKYQEGRRKSTASSVLHSQLGSDCRRSPSINSSIDADETTFGTCNEDSVESLINLPSDIVPVTISEKNGGNASTLVNHTSKPMSSGDENDNTLSNSSIEKEKGDKEVDPNNLFQLESSDKPPGGP